MSDYVKFTHQRETADIPTFAALAELSGCRRKLVELQLIGVNSDGVSFGNVSVRDGATKNFYITGSQTGHLPELTPACCARVVAYDFERNCVRYQGSAIPSSESLTHAAIYEADPGAGAVIHCHDQNLWLALLDRAPTTPNTAEYGTPQMACEIMRLFRDTDVRNRKIVLMAGHEAGIVTFGSDLKQAFAVLIRERSLDVSQFATGRTRRGELG